MNVKRYSIFFLVFLLALFAACAVSFAAEPDAKVEGMWLKFPNFPSEAEVVSFETDDDTGEVMYSRMLKDALLFTVRRQSKADSEMQKPGDVQGFIEMLVNTTEGDEDSISVDAEAGDFLDKYPFATAQYKTGRGEDTRVNSDLYIFTDKWVFVLAFEASPDGVDALEGYDPDDWIEGAEFVGGGESGKSESGKSEGGEAPVYELLAKDADLSKAPDVIVEPDEPPFNLGGWKQGNTPVFNFKVERGGDYKVTILYSKQDDGDGAAELAFVHINKEQSYSGTLIVTLPVTGKDWSNYEEIEEELSLAPGNVTLELEPTDAYKGDYIINLRSVTLTFLRETEE